jgi:hypothetical protein
MKEHQHESPVAAADAFAIEPLANALPPVGHRTEKVLLSSKPVNASLPKPSSSSSKSRTALKAKQELRKFRGTDTPDPALGIDMDEFTTFTQYLRSSQRILALIGAGLSVASGLVTFRGDDRRWRDMEPQDLSNIEALEADPVKVWWFFSDRMKRAQEAKPNHGHVALAKLAKEKEGFFAVNQNIDGRHIQTRHKACADYYRLVSTSGLPRQANSTDTWYAFRDEVQQVRFRRRRSL